MDSRDAARLIASAVSRRSRWADLGAGTGTFTNALAMLLGAGGRVYAIERDPRAIRSLETLARHRAADDRAEITVMRADFTAALELPPLDGALLANALHFVTGAAQAPLLGRISAQLEPGGALLVVEYDNRPPSRWVPFPVSLARLTELARETGLGAPELIGRRESAFGGTMYAARVSAPDRA